MKEVAGVIGTPLAEHILMEMHRISVATYYVGRGDATALQFEV